MPLETHLNLTGEIEINNAKIYNYSGQIVKEITFESNLMEQNVDVSELSKGIYFIKINNYSAKTFIVD